MKLVKGIFERKAVSISPSDCKIEKVIELTAEEYEEFTQKLYRDWPFIEENVDLMYVDDDEIMHCLLVLGDGREDGILVEAEGASYARYAALFSGARQFVQREKYPSLSQYSHEMIESVGRWAEELLKRQERGVATIRLSEVRSQNNLSDFPVKLFLRMLSDRPEFSRICLDYDDETIEAAINDNYLYESEEQALSM